MSWYNPVTWFFGEDADTYAKNVAAQWRLLEKTAQTADPEAWQRAYDLMVSYYGPPASTEAQILENARKQYMADINKAADDGFMQGVKEAPGIIGSGVSAVAGSFWGGMSPWMKFAAILAVPIVILVLINSITVNTLAIGRGVKNTAKSAADAVKELPKKVQEKLNKKHAD